LGNAHVVFKIKLKKKRHYLFLEEAELTIFYHDKFSILTKLVVICHSLLFADDSYSVYRRRVQAKWLHSESTFLLNSLNK